MAFIAQFKTWQFYWFECPYCTYSSYSAYARAEMLEHPTRLLVRFRCKRCGQDSRLKHPYLNTVSAFAMSFILFMVIYRLAFAEEGWRLSVVLGMLLGLVIVAALHCALTRVANRYVPIARVEL
jgi:hypothetical protein